MKKLAYISVLICCILFSFVANGQNFSMEKVVKTPPSPQRLVNDYTNHILTPEQIQALENKLVQFDDSTSTQITVVIVPSLDGMDVVDAATELGRNWQVGQKKNNNGVVLLISEEHKLAIAPGYGLEGVLPDITTKQIIDDIIVPKFKGNDYYRGIDEGTDAIIQATKGEFKASAHPSRKKGIGFGRIIFYIVMIIVFLAAFGGGSKGGGSFMSRRGMSAWTIGTMLGGGGGSGWSGGGGSSGGGGFGGFGGGSFGGGGSSGSW